MGVSSAVIDIITGRPGSSADPTQNLIDMLTPGRAEAKRKKEQDKAERAEALRLQKAEEEAKAARSTSIRSSILTGGIRGVINPSPTTSRSRLLGN